MISPQIKGTITAFLLFLIIFGIAVFILSQRIGIIVYLTFIPILILIVSFFVYSHYLTTHEKLQTRLRQRLSFSPYIVGILLISIMFIVASVFTGLITLSPIVQTEVGVNWYYQWSADEDILDNLNTIKDMGITIVRIEMCTDCWDKTEIFFNHTRFSGLKVYVVMKHWNEEYVIRFHNYIHTYQVFNEIDIMGWNDDHGFYPFQADEVVNMMKGLVNNIKKIDSDARLYTTFTMGFAIRVDLIPRMGEISNIVDFFGISFYQKEGEILAPANLNYLRSLTGKEVIVAELGSCDVSEDKQSDYIINGLDFFKRNGVRTVIVFTWEYCGSYSIKGKQSQNDISNWININ